MSVKLWPIHFPGTYSTCVWSTPDAITTADLQLKVVCIYIYKYIYLSYASSASSATLMTVIVNVTCVNLHSFQLKQLY